MLKNRRLFATAVRNYSWLFVTIRDYSEFSQTRTASKHSDAPAQKPANHTQGERRPIVPSDSLVCVDGECDHQAEPCDHSTTMGLLF